MVEQTGADVPLGTGSRGSACRKWYAWHDFTPGSVPTLYVTGECLVESPGFKVTLARSEPQGAHAAVLVLTKTVIPPADCTPPHVPTFTPVSYADPMTALCTHVRIQPDEVLIDVFLSN